MGVGHSLIYYKLLLYASGLLKNKRGKVLPSSTYVRWSYFGPIKYTIATVCLVTKNKEMKLYIYTYMHIIVTMLLPNLSQIVICSIWESP